MRYFDDIELENLSEEEVDELYRPRKTNSRKSMAPLFVYLILQEKTNWNKHLTQNEILAELEKEPYEIKIERKALGRVLNQLSDSDVNIVSSRRNGFWYDQCA